MNVSFGYFEKKNVYNPGSNELTKFLKRKGNIYLILGRYYCRCCCL